jgi:DNA (cytosine-5)-methyltransferase 1
VSLFSGAGGFDLGIEAAGFTTKLCTDVDHHSCRTLEANRRAPVGGDGTGRLSEARVVQRDIRDYPTSEMLADAGLQKEEVALVYGGAPCQSFSVFGRRKGMDDPRGLLLWDFLRVVREIEPTCFVFENVAGLLSIDNGGLFGEFLDALSKDEAGDEIYTVTRHLLDTASFGVPQYRSRVIVFGAKGKKVPCPAKTHAAGPEDGHGLPPAATVGDALGGLQDPSKMHLPNHVGRTHGQDIVDRYGGLRYGQRDPKTRINRLNPKRPSFTIVVGSDKGGGKGHVHPFAPREVTPRESARLQSFPDFWEFSGTGRHPIRQVGNAVPPVFAGAIGAHLLKEVFGVEDAPGYDEIVRRLGIDYLPRYGRNNGDTKHPMPSCAQKGATWHEPMASTKS